MLAFQIALVEGGVGQIGDQHRLTRPEHLSRAPRVSLPEPPVLPELPQEMLLLFFGVRSGELVYAPVVLSDVEQAPVSELGHYEACDVLQRLLVIERSRKSRTGRREQRQAPPRRYRLGPCELLPHEQHVALLLRLLALTDILDHRDKVGW